MKTTLTTLALAVVCVIVALSGCSRDSAVGPAMPETPASNAWDAASESSTAAKVACGYTGKSHALLLPGYRRIGLTLCRDHFARGTDEREAVDGMIAHINSFEGVSLSLFVAGLEDHTDYDDTLDRNGVNKIDFVDPDDCTAADCSFSGRTMTFSNSSGEIVEFDLAFNENTNWAFGGPSSWAMSDGYSYFRTVLLHELNHGFGFPHVLNATSDVSIMGGKTGKWVGQKHTGLKAYDHGHLRYHYAQGGDPRPDLVLSNYTTYWDSGKSNWQCTLTDGLSRTTIFYRGSLDVSYTYMNRGGSYSNGYSTQIYLSEDETLSGDDVLLSSATSVTTGSWPEFETDLITRSVTIPSGTPAGTYHVIVKIDTEDTVDESRDGNNILTIHEPLRVLKLVRSTTPALYW